MNRFVIFGIVDDALSDTVRFYQNSLSRFTKDQRAQCFPVHVTLRGPFWADTGGLHALTREIDRHCESCSPFKIVVSGPVFVEPDWCWLEIQPGTPGFSACLDLHTHVENMVRPLMTEDDVPAAHKGEYYRAHMTVGWGVTAGAPDRIFAGQVSLTGTIRSIAVARYPDAWPTGGDIRVVENIPLIRV